ncbi:hypothetical protein ASPACDRAFT_49718 [Aspergillus aculeatus ATCC 16872]|uniref:Uncharacterized protein n=1 Tax=Aspergillus aculeatus (strain ATCC 16872 / CBS 172.66 / WB 5094) TaxID=690307 RepID=A0A1L9X576_ASPA1|nr:uncharacterized protein ASPACDRAFT_49718 [Aspergillus aculeatus ATCC 16872]OJK03601.1 hypothetical protein ASPACDRAFT_49718 [Aspergillus aculeatus ATCC 16872]
MNIHYMPSPSRQHRRRKRRVYHPPPLFWDKLTKVWLTKSALRENDRRILSLSPTQTSFSKLCTFAPDFLRSCPATCLREIRRLSRCGGPDLSDLRHHPPPTDFYQYSLVPTSSDSRRPTTMYTQTLIGNTTVYDPHFENHLLQNGIYMPFSRYPDGSRPSKPGNFAEITRRIQAPRLSSALPKSTTLDQEYEDFLELNDDAADEQVVITEVLPALEGKHRARSQVAGGHPFKNLIPLTDGTLASAKPDLYHGARPNQLAPAIQKQLHKQILPSSQSNRPVAPNFFIEAKGQYGTARAATRQACYDGALGARAMHTLRQFGDVGDSGYDDMAYTIMSTYCAGTLGIYATHPTKSRSPDRFTDYVMTQIGHYSMIGSPESYRQGLDAYRNSRDLAKEYRDEIIRQANERYQYNRQSLIHAIHPCRTLLEAHIGLLQSIRTSIV